jgi:DNA repair photolyase
MIYPYVGDFLLSPIPLQLSFNYCSHKCSYCFANLNNPNRTFDIKSFQAQLKGIYSNNSLPSLLLREQYPVLVSNLVDPFATSNYSQAIPTLEMLATMGIPVSVQTRGGKGIDDVLSFLPKSIWYISIPMLNDDIRKQVEPGAPTIESRLMLIDKLKHAGHEVVVGINPTVEEFVPGNDGKTLINLLHQKGVPGIWLAAMHFNQKQLRVMPEKDRVRIGEVIIKKGLKNARNLQMECYKFLRSLKENALSLGMSVEGFWDGEVNNFFKPYQQIYSKTFPTYYDFINWCHEHKADGDKVYYHEFEALMLQKLIGGRHNISPYMTCMNRALDAEVRESVGYKHSFRWLLNLCWNEPRMKRTFERIWTYAISVNYDGQDMALNLDEHGNRIYHFHRKTFTDDYFIANELKNN